MYIHIATKKYTKTKCSLVINKQVTKKPGQKYKKIKKVTREEAKKRKENGRLKKLKPRRGSGE